MYKFVIMLSIVLIAFSSLVRVESSSPVDIETQNIFIPNGSVLTSVSDKYVTEGTRSLKIEFKSGQSAVQPGNGFWLSSSFLPDFRKSPALFADIYLEGDKPLNLRMRQYTNNGKEEYQGLDPLQPGWNKGIFLNAVDLMQWIPVYDTNRICVYETTGNRDATLYIDNLHWDNLHSLFTRIEHIETLKDPISDIAETKRGFIAFGRHYMEHIFPHTKPDNRLEKIGMFLAQGEQEPTTVNIYAIEDIRKLSVTVSTLNGPNNAKIPSSAWDNRVVVFLDQRENMQVKRYFPDFPSYIESLKHPVAVPKGTTKTLWLTLNAPSDCKPGLYNGTVKIKADGRLQNIPISVRVLPFSLSAKKGIFRGMYYTALGAKSPEKMLVDLVDMRKHGMTSVGYCIWPYDKDTVVKVTNVHFTEGNLIDMFMDAYMKAGFTQPVLLLMDYGRFLADARYKMDDPKWDELYLNTNRELLKRGREKGWPEIILQPMDEVSWQGEEAKKKQLHLLRLAKRIGYRIEIDGAGDEYMWNEAGPLADMYVVSSNFLNLQEMKKAKNMNKIVCIYNFDEEGMLPETGRYVRGIYSWAHALDGEYNWEYRGAYGDFYDPMDTQWGDTMHSYPRQGDRLGGPAIGFEGEREGIDDRGYLDTLDALIRRARRAGGDAAVAADLAAADSAKLKSRVIGGDRANRHLAAWDKTYTPEEASGLGLKLSASKAASYTSGRYKMNVGIEYHEYDDIRWMAATHICNLMSKLGMLSDTGSLSRPQSALR